MFKITPTKLLGGIVGAGISYMAPVSTATKIIAATTGCINGAATSDAIKNLYNSTHPLADTRLEEPFLNTVSITSAYLVFMVDQSGDFPVEYRIATLAILGGIARLIPNKMAFYHNVLKLSLGNPLLVNSIAVACLHMSGCVNESPPLWDSFLAASTTAISIQAASLTGSLFQVLTGR